MTVTYEELTERNAAFVTADEQSSLRSSAVFVCGVGGMGGAAAEAGSMTSSSATLWS